METPASQGATHVGYYVATSNGILLAPAVYVQAGALYESDRAADRERAWQELKKRQEAADAMHALASAGARPPAPRARPATEQRPSQRRPHGQGQARR